MNAESSPAKSWHRQLFERNVAGVFRVRTDGSFLDVNKAMASMLGYTREDLLRAGAGVLYFDPSDRGVWVEEIRRQGSLTNHTARLRRRDGEEVWILENAVLLEDDGDQVILGTAVDITERKRLEQELAHLAYHDPLTGLANRRLLHEIARKELARANRTRSRVGVLYFDLVRFKRINDAFGHAAGDRVLVELAERIDGSVRRTDTLARIGGDEFAVLLVDLGEPEDALAAARHIRSQLDAPFHVEAETFHVDARIGIAIYPDHAGSLDELLSQADLRMTRANLQAKGIVLESPATDEDRRAEIELEEAFLRGLEKDAFELHYQSIHRFPDSRPVAAEAFLRWRHPERGVLAAAEFLALAERTGRLRRLDQDSIAKAVRQLARWARPDGPEWVAVNVAAATFEDPELPEIVADALGEEGVEPSRLALEVTERATMRDPERAGRTFRALRDLGVRIVIDDFGQGHSSLAFLARHSFDALKLGRFFLRGIGGGGERERLAEGVVGLALGLDLAIIGEGVETDEQLAWLVAQGCHYAQGFFLGAPMPPGKAGALWGVAG